MCRVYVKSEGGTLGCCLSVCVLLEYIIIVFFKMLYGEEYSYVVARCIFKEILVNISERNVFLIYRLLGRLNIAENIPCYRCVVRLYWNVPSFSVKLFKILPSLIAWKKNARRFYDLPLERPWIFRFWCRMKAWNVIDEKNFPSMFFSNRLRAGVKSKMANLPQLLLNKFEKLPVISFGEINGK